MSKIAIIGSGIAGLFSALKLANNDHKVVIITKQRVKDSSTNWAQGGIASVISKSDSFKKHLDDTIENGHGIIDENVAYNIIKEYIIVL